MRAVEEWGLPSHVIVFSLTLLSFALQLVSFHFAITALIMSEKDSVEMNVVDALRTKLVEKNKKLKWSVKLLSNSLSATKKPTDDIKKLSNVLKKISTANETLQQENETHRVSTKIHSFQSGAEVWQLCHERLHNTKMVFLQSRILVTIKMTSRLFSLDYIYDL